MERKDLEKLGWIFIPYHPKGDMDERWFDLFVNENDKNLFMSYFGSIKQKGYEHIDCNMIIYKDYNKENEHCNHNKFTLFDGKIRTLEDYNNIINKISLNR